MWEAVGSTADGVWRGGPAEVELFGSVAAVPTGHRLYGGLQGGLQGGRGSRHDSRTSPVLTDEPDVFDTSDSIPLAEAQASRVNGIVLNKFLETPWRSFANTPCIEDRRHFSNEVPRP